MNEVIRVMLAGPRATLDEYAESLRFQSDIRLVAQITDPQDAIQWAEEFCPDIVVLDECWGSTALNCGSQVARSNPGIVVALGTNKIDTETFRQAQAWGFAGLLGKPVQSEQVRELVYGKADSIRRFGSAKREPAFGSHANVARQEMIVFYSPKGGVGKTTLALSFAAACLGNRNTRLQPALIDFDLKADVMKMVQLESLNTVLKWDDFKGQPVDKRGLEAIVTKHPSGLAIIGGIKSPFDAQDLTAELARDLLSTVRRYYDVVVVDTGPEIHDASIVAFEMATRIFVVGTVDITTLRNIAETEQHFTTLMIDSSKVSLVMNRAMPKPQISMRAIGNVIKYPIIARIPEDPQVQVAGNDAKIMTVDFPTSGFSVAVRKLAQGIVPVLEEPAKRRGFWSFLWPFGRHKREVA